MAVRSANGRAGKPARFGSNGLRAASNSTPAVALEAPVESGCQLPPIVGVGASAGGLEAFTELLHHLSSDTGLAFVLIQHLDPSHESLLTELLSKASTMPVTEVTGETRPQANHVYIIPPHSNLSVSGGVLQTPPRAASGRNMPVDSFLDALADDCGQRAVGVVLSGTGADGTHGLGAIKAAGGVTFAQELESARFDGMPRNAIAAGVVDHVLAPAEIAKHLALLAHGLLSGTELVEEPAGSGLATVLRLLRGATGVDFTHYKRSTLQRRLKRRMTLRGFETVEDYIHELELNHDEAIALSDSFFITVTQFFREPSLFEDLKNTVFPALAANRLKDDAIRIWTPGCATGEEAYSIAVCLTEFIENTKASVQFEIFATDISEAAIEKARSGTYSGATLAEVSPSRLARFFTPSERGYQIAKSIRDVCVFARHNLAQDPPFSRLDLISCCNLLIYLGPALQRKILSTLQYALNPAGYLALGPTESIATLPQAFQPVEHTHKIFALKPAVSVPPPPLRETRRDGRPDLPGRVPERHPGVEVQREVDRWLLAQYAPAGVVIDDRLNILQVRGRTAPFLELAPGEPTQNLLKLAREGLVSGLGKAIRAAGQTHATTAESGFRIDDSGQLCDVTMTVIPLRGGASPGERCFLVLFEDAPPAGTTASARRPAGGDKDRSSRLRRELVAARDYLQSIVAENAATLEELRAANEEAQAGNEELETAQEELESANEELNTLNEELKISNVEFSKVNRDLSDLLESISIPLVMVGKDLRIRRFTRAVQPILNLIPSDVGRSITDLRPQMELPDLRHLLLDAMAGGSRRPCDIRDAFGRWYSLRILPSLGADGRTDGAVMMWIDIDAAKRGLDFAEAIVETVREPLVILNQNLHVVKANKAFYEVFRAAPADVEDRLIYDLGNGQWNIPKLRELLESVLPAHATFRNFEVIHEFERVGRKVMLLNGSEIFNPNAQARTILLAIEDVTDRKQAEDALRTTNADLQSFAYALAHDLQEPLRMVVNFTELLAQDYAGKLGQEADMFIAYSVSGALRMESLLKAMLAYWEVAERKQVHLVRVDCGAVLSKVLLNLHEAIAESGASVTSGPLPAVEAEEIGLIQLFQNLISNSIKYRGAEVPRIQISASREGDTWVFVVRDNGAGIDPRDAERVFGMFKRLHGSELPGTGIGLALCRKVVERMGGRIWVESEAGQGATFKFTIPPPATGAAAQRPEGK